MSQAFVHVCLFAIIDVYDDFEYYMHNLQNNKERNKEYFCSSKFT